MSDFVDDVRPSGRCELQEMADDVRPMGRRVMRFNLEWREALRSCPAKVRFEVYEAVMDYAACGRVAELSPMGRLAFAFIRLEIDREAQQEAEAAERVDERRNRGGAPVGNRNAAKGSRRADKEVKIQPDSTQIQPANNLKTTSNNLKSTSSEGCFEEKEKRKEKESFPPAPPFKEKENKKEKEVISSSSVPPSAGSDDEDELGRLIESYKQKPAWKESMRQKFLMTDSEIDRYLDKFYLDMRCKEVNVSNLAALFTVWLKKEKSNGNAFANFRQSVAPDWARNNGVPIRGKIVPRCGVIEA